MGSEVKDKLPTVVIGKLDLKEGSEEWNSVRDQVYEGLEEYGAVEVIVDDERLSIPKQRLYEKSKQVFTMPLETLVPLCEKTANGYKWVPSQPLVEALNFRYGVTPGIIETISKSLGDQEFCDLVHAYAKGATELCELVRKMIFNKLGLENLWDEHNKSTYGGLTMIKYRLPKAGEKNVGLAAHKDPQIAAILSQNQIGVSGLQLMKKDGQWIDCQYSSPNSFIFFNNECLAALTNGRLYAPLHQVIMGDKERYSIAVFTGFRGIVEVPEKLVDEEHPLRFKPFDPAEFIKSRQKSVVAGADIPLTLEEYCGV